MIAKMKSITVFILAGGQSSRMGADKAFLELAGKPLILRAVDLSREVSADVKILGEPEKFVAYGPVIEDIYRDRGPLGGIHAALTNSQSDCNLMLAVDLPFVPARFLEHLLARAESSQATVTVPSLGGYFQPLCSVYRKEFVTAAERALTQNRNKIDPLFQEVSLCIVSEEEMHTNGFDSSIFRNLNTPEDWHQAKREFATGNR
jgi:molybdopterin-guanine dinucleotide biosynthesis protein A